MNTRVYSEKTIKNTSSVLAIIYSLIVFLVITYAILEFVTQKPPDLNILIIGLVPLGAVIGILKRMSGIVPIMIIVSGYGIVHSLLLLGSGSIIVGLGGILFSAFWLYFFTNKSVREYYHYKGITLF